MEGNVASKSRVTVCGQSQVKCSLYDLEQVASEMERQSASQNNGNLTCFLGIVYPVTYILLTFTSSVTLASNFTSCSEINIPKDPFWFAVSDYFFTPTKLKKKKSLKR